MGRSAAASHREGFRVGSFVTVVKGHLSLGTFNVVEK
jgi:hypothetical protein